MGSNKELSMKMLKQYQNNCEALDEVRSNNRTIRIIQKLLTDAMHDQFVMLVKNNK